MNLDYVLYIVRVDQDNILKNSAAVLPANV